MDLPRRHFLYLLGTEGMRVEWFTSQHFQQTPPTKPLLRISEASIGSLAAITHHLRILQRQGNISILSELTIHLSVIENALNATMDERQRRDLWRTLAQTQLIGRLSLHAFAKQGLAKAKMFNEAAIISARKSGDTALIGAAIGHLANFHLRGGEKDPIQASQLLKQAQEYAKEQKALLGWFALLNAAIASIEGNQQECEQLLLSSLETAYQTQEIIDPYFTDFGVVSVQVFAGNSLLTVGEPRKASQWLTEAALADLSYNRHASVYYDLSRVYAASNELEEAQKYALKAMDCALETDNLYIVPRFFALAHMIQQKYSGNAQASAIAAYAMSVLQA